MRDTLRKEGAARLVLKIGRYWRERGLKVRSWSEPLYSERPWNSI
jgi:hypothetical protein